jgi:hypothetical protein
MDEASKLVPILPVKTRDIVAVDVGQRFFGHVVDLTGIEIQSHGRIEIDEQAAAKRPFDRSRPLNGGWGEVRLPDGQIIKK